MFWPMNFGLVIVSLCKNYPRADELDLHGDNLHRMTRCLQIHSLQAAHFCHSKKLTMKILSQESISARNNSTAPKIHF